MKTNPRSPLSITFRFEAELRVRVCRDGRRAVFDVETCESVNGETRLKFYRTDVRNENRDQPVQTWARFRVMLPIT